MYEYVLLTYYTNYNQFVDEKIYACFALLCRELRSVCCCMTDKQVTFIIWPFNLYVANTEAVYFTGTFFLKLDSSSLLKMQ